MPESDGEKPVKKKRGLWWKLPVSAILLLLLAFAVFRFVVYQRVQMRVTAIKEAGYPTTLEGLDAWYVSPDGPNAADIYLKVFDAMVGDEQFEETLPILGSRVEPPKPGEKMPADVVRRVKHYVEQNTEAIRLLNQAAEVEGCRYPIDLSQVTWIDLQTPHYHPVQHAARLLKLNFYIDLENGDTEAALRSGLAIDSLARSISEEPIVLSSLICFSTHSIAFDCYTRVLQSDKLSETQLAQIRSSLLEDDLSGTMHRGMAGDLCSALAIYRDLSDVMDLNSSKGLWTLRAWKLSGLLDLDESYFLDTALYYDGKITEPKWPLPEFHDEAPGVYKVAHTITPDYHYMVNVTYEVETIKYLLLLAVAAEQYRIDHGDWPDDLEQLVPKYVDAVPGDIHSGEALRYKHEDGHCVIYSVWRDGVDQGGRPYDEEGYLTDTVDISIVLGNTSETLWPIKVVEADNEAAEEDIGMSDELPFMMWDDSFEEEEKAYDAYLEKIEKEGFPELTPRPAEGYQVLK